MAHLAVRATRAARAALALAALALAALASAAALAAAALAGFIPAATASELRLRAEYTNMRAEDGVVQCIQSPA